MTKEEIQTIKHYVEAFKLMFKLNEKMKQFKKEEIIPNNLLVKMMDYVYNSPIAWLSNDYENTDEYGNDFAFGWLSDLLLDPDSSLESDESLDFFHRSYDSAESLLQDSVTDTLYDETKDKGMKDEDEINDYIEEHFNERLEDIYFIEDVTFINKTTGEKEYYTYYHEGEDLLRYFDNFHFGDWTRIYDFFLELLDEIGLKEAYEKQDVKSLKILLKDLLNKPKDDN